MSGTKNGRRPWSKFWDADYLADDKVRRLSWPARGVLQYLWSYSRTQTDEPGRLVVGGICLGPDQLLGVIRAGSGTHLGVRCDFICGWINEVICAGFFIEDEQGILYSPRIVREVENTEKLAGYGRKGAARRYGRESHYNRGTAIATPIAEAIATPISRSEAEAEAEAEQPRARAHEDSVNPEKASQQEDGGQKPTNTPERQAVKGIEAITGLTLVESDVTRIERAVAGKDARQVKAALERIDDAYHSGTVRSIVAFASRVFSEAPTPPRDRSDDAFISQVQHVCRTLDLDYGRFHVQILQAVKRAPTRVTSAVHSTWEDAQAKLVSWDNHAAVMQRFLERMEVDDEKSLDIPAEAGETYP